MTFVLAENRNFPNFPTVLENISDVEFKQICLDGLGTDTA
jgi:hypothetical protein